MNRLFILLVLLFGGIKCDRPLSWQDNQYWKANCGTKPYHQKSFVDYKRHIVGGQLQPGNLAPWAVRAGQVGRLCSGTLISQRHVLLASHCIMMSKDSAPDTVRQSSWVCEGNDLVLRQDNNYYEVRDSRDQILSNKVSKMVLFNFCYQPVVDYDDFMIMELKEDIALNDFAFPACITNDMRFQQPGLIIRVTAYGHDNWDPNGQGTYVLRNGVFKIAGLWRDDRGFLIVNEAKTTEIRAGDSGGSVIHYVNGRYYVIGVVDYFYFNQFTTGIGSVATHYDRICHHTGRCN